MAEPSESKAKAGVQVGPAIPPLNVSGMVVTKADLVAALRLYVPRLAGIEEMGGDRFILNVESADTTKADE